MSTMTLCACPAKRLGIEAGNHAIEPRADRQQEIAVLNREVRAAGSHDSGPADEQRVVICDQIDGEPGRLERNIQHVEQLAELRSVRVPAGCRCRRAAAAGPSG